MKFWFSVFILVLGVGLFSHGSYIQAKAWLAQHLIEQAWQQALVTPNEQVKPWFYADSYVTAQLNWPSRGKTLSILAGASGRNLAFAPSHYLPSGELGSEHGALIAGHNDTHFTFLQKVKVGEQFSLQTQSGNIVQYQVRGVEVIHQSQHAFLQRSGLYLLTCYPFDSLASGTDLRLLVSADKVSSSTSTTSS
ncbi:MULTISPECIES: class GN sortase [unclassified Pseudoalteromonas]|uniref:class GN sortase n=1 Tax=unclassified Pseudoalteromonas TaxID=194690 RepID=UPI000B3CC6BB|nr:MULTISPECIES: class GN sortase [unclassified Pseudoalteromonas]MDN3378404.1 class GN sortase [Pseudoalteromonas sp. APC 3893]MDN3386324.1 class GN sortase [Pseudoalteromonas sp. APC 4017]OUS71179.1 sortase, marine proteobacterial type [Pseudoalteromonas sp. A601]